MSGFFIAAVITSFWPVEYGYMEAGLNEQIMVMLMFLGLFCIATILTIVATIGYLVTRKASTKS